MHVSESPGKLSLMGALEWLRANPALSMLLVYLVLGVVSALFKPRTAEEYAKMPPWIAATLKFVAAIGLDPVKVVEALVSIMKIPAPGNGDPRSSSNPPPPPEKTDQG